MKWLRWLGDPRGALRPQVLAPASVVVGAVTITAFGFADVGVGWILAGTAVLTFAALQVGRGVDSQVGAESRVRALGWALGAVLLVLAGSWLYPQFQKEDFRPRYYVLSDAEEAQCMKVSGHPGGEPLDLAPQLCGGQPYAVECETDVDGSTWLRLFTDPPYWIPAFAVEPASSADARLPGCS